MNREDFEILKNNIIYFDNGATTLKPKVLSEETCKYYNEYSANAHRGDYDMSLKVDAMYEKTRELVKNWIGAKKSSEIVFTSGTTDSLNKIIFGYFKDKLNPGDEVILTKSEHASNILPWFELKDELKIELKYIDLEDLQVTLDNVKKCITDKTKVISLAEVTNVAGDIRPMKEIIDLAHQNNILVIMDAAQSVAHKKIDVSELDVDFMAFSAHKMYGPTGVGILYGKEELLNNIRPIIFGGGMNASYSSDGVRIYNELPYLLEAGTQNIAGVIGFGSVLEYLTNIGIDKIANYELELKNYCLKRLEEVEQVTVYNKASKGGIIAFNYKDVFAQDLAIYLNKYHICVRAGNHCAKTLKEEIGIKNTVRISFGLYNTKEEIDKFIEVLKNPNLKNEII